MPVRFALTVFALVLFAASPALAQDTPYSPLKRQPGDIINFPGYDRSPLRLEFNELRQERVLNGSRLDFKHVYAVPYEEMIDYFVNAYHDKKKLMVIDPDVVPFTDSAEMNLLGIQEKQDPARFTLGHPRIPGMITIEVVPEGSGSAVIVQNVVFARIYSGVMPVRADYTPRGAKSLPFRWN
jgi:hypothetical protein